jgi:hypothetical protein
MSRTWLQPGVAKRSSCLAVTDRFLGGHRHLGSVVAAIVAVVFVSDAPAAVPGIRFRVDFDLMMNCDQPIQVRNFIVRGSGAGVLNLDKSASADIRLNAGLFPKTIHFEGGLGRGSTVAPGGASQVSVVGRNRLRIIWDLPNNQLIGTITVVGQSCSANLGSKLKPGRTQHTFFDGSQFYFCGRPALVRSACAVY